MLLLQWISSNGMHAPESGSISLDSGAHMHAPASVVPVLAVVWFSGHGTHRLRAPATAP
jgi:hypothetical protein